MEMCIFGAFRRQTCALPKIKVPNPGLTQKSKVPKWVCRSTLANFCNDPPFFAIYGPARDQIFGKTAEKIAKKYTKNCLFGLFPGVDCLSVSSQQKRNVATIFLSGISLVYFVCPFVCVLYVDSRFLTIF